MDAPAEVPPPPPRSRRRHVRILIVVLALAIVVYGVIGAIAGARALARGLTPTMAWAFAAAVGLSVTGMLARSARWTWYLRRLGLHVRLGYGVLTYGAGLAMGLTPGKAGEIVKAYYVSRREATPVSKAIAGIVMERAADALAALIVLAAAFAVLGPQYVALGLALLALTIALVLALRSERGAAWIWGRLGRWAPLNRPARWLHTVHGHLRGLLPGLPLAAGTLVGVSAWTLETTGMLLMAQSLGLSLSWLECALVYAASSIAGILTFLPGGLGATEGGMVGLLLSFGVSTEDAALLTLAQRVATLGSGVLLGAIALAVLRTGARETNAGARPSPE